MVPFSPIYDYESCYEFPNGDVVETIDLLPSDQVYRAKSTGWACLTPRSWKGAVKDDGIVVINSHSGGMKPDTSSFKVLHNKDIKTQRLVENGMLEQVDIIQRLCFGVYRCPRCDYSERPRIPQKGKKDRSTIPIPPKSKCFKHECQLEWHCCPASMVSVFYHTRLRAEVHHTGVHEHEQPPPLRSDVLAKREFNQRVIGAPGQTPGQLAIGNVFQNRAGDLHEAYHHSGRIARERRELLDKAKSKQTIASFLELERTLGFECIGSSSFRGLDGHITLQTQFMRDILAEKQSCLQSDSVHSMILDLEFSGLIYVSFTSGYCDGLKRSIPLVITVIFGQ